ncbi:MAG TPA: roadblock/LC7 domain-containing protein [Solirubrobacterales bacterium]|nr:roadblock/LC7 domain-containing protein [Solirubrobacterales bacterium]
MTAEQALADLTEISSQVEAAALFDSKGKVAASTLSESEQFVRAVQDLLAAATEARQGSLNQVEASTAEGSVFVVREGESYIAATTGPEPTVALVFYDLKTALRAAAAGAGEKKAAPRRRAPKKKPEGDGDAA